MGKLTLNTADRYQWGNAGMGWLLKTSPELTIAERVLGPGVKEKRHYHKETWQFFYILEGEGTMILQDDNIPICIDESIEVDPLCPHQLVNTSDEPLRYLVVSRPNSFEDRVELD